MMEWLDLSGLGPHLARFRRCLDKQPRREFSELGLWDKLGRLLLIVVALAVFCVPLIWLLFLS